MYILKQDLAFLEIHAVLKEDKDNPHNEMFWQCIYTQARIEFIDDIVRLDHGGEIEVILARPFCPDCKPDTFMNPHVKLAKLDEPVNHRNLKEKNI